MIGITLGLVALGISLIGINTTLCQIRDSIDRLTEEIADKESEE